MDILILEKALHTAKTLTTIAFVVNGLVIVILAYKFVTKNSH